MSLPNIPFPFELPVDIPLLVHPAVVHFAVAIPIVILMLEVINLFFKKRAISMLSLFLIFIVIASMSVAYFTGSVDGKEAYSLLVSEGQAELKEHKLLGIYLVYGSVVLFLFKLIFMAFPQIVARLFFIIIVMSFIAVTLKQGKDGGELVYEYGANSKAVASVEEKLEELQEEYDELKEESEESGSDTKLKELQEKYDALLKSSKETTDTKSEEAKTEAPAQTEAEEEDKAKVEETPAKTEEKKEESKESESSAVSLDIPSDSNGSN